MKNLCFFPSRSKTGVSVNELGDQYILLGPYVEFKAKQEVEEEDFPYHHPLGQAVEKARQKGYKVCQNRPQTAQLWTTLAKCSFYPSSTRFIAAAG